MGLKLVNVLEVKWEKIKIDLPMLGRGGVFSLDEWSGAGSCGPGVGPTIDAGLSLYPGTREGSSCRTGAAGASWATEDSLSIEGGMTVSVAMTVSTGSLGGMSPNGVLSTSILWSTAVGPGVVGSSSKSLNRTGDV